MLFVHAVDTINDKADISGFFAKEILVVRFKIPAFFFLTGKWLKYCVKFSTCLICFALFSLDYSIAKEILPQDLSDLNQADHTTSFSFIVWGHPRGGRAGEVPLNLDEIAELVSELEVDFVVITGDMIEGRVNQQQTSELIHKDWDDFDEYIKRLGVPVYRLPGNHDVNNYLTRDVYFERYPHLPFSFIYKDSKFILLDSHGIDQRSNDSRQYWGAWGLPFDDNQIDFIKQEVLSQDNFAHMFFFMHHTTPWAESDSAWWKDIHPLIASGKTRAVFSGDNPNHMKFAHIEQDGIHYILNNTFPTRRIEAYKRHPDWPRISLRQLDNLEYVQVKGGKIKYRTYVVGALTKEGSSWRYWDEVKKMDQNIASRRGLASRLKSNILNNSPRRIFFGIFVLIGSGFLFGIFFTLLLKHFKNNPAR